MSACPMLARCSCVVCLLGVVCRPLVCVRGGSVAFWCFRRFRSRRRMVGRQMDIVVARGMRMRIDLFRLGLQPPVGHPVEKERNEEHREERGSQHAANDAGADCMTCTGVVGGMLA